ncbi:hypothetical protein F5880DRAFT_1502230 [Lentinula raphanica]|nr:hypothetical protein F5880DRAFT_1502230 [Lentinula raphanica]
MSTSRIGGLDVNEGGTGLWDRKAEAVEKSEAGFRSTKPLSGDQLWVTRVHFSRTSDYWLSLTPEELKKNLEKPPTNLIYRETSDKRTREDKIQASHGYRPIASKPPGSSGAAGPSQLNPGASSDGQSRSSPPTTTSNTHRMTPDDDIPNKKSKMSSANILNKHSVILDIYYRPTRDLNNRVFEELARTSKIGTDSRINTIVSSLTLGNGQFIAVDPGQNPDSNVGFDSTYVPSRRPMHKQLVAPCPGTLNDPEDEAPTRDLQKQSGSEKKPTDCLERSLNETVSASVVEGVRGSAIQMKEAAEERLMFACDIERNVTVFIPTEIFLPFARYFHELH